MEINVPGISSSTGIDTNKLIEDLLDAERIPINRLEQDITTSQQEIKIWDDLAGKMRNLQDAAKRLYGFQNPFAERLVTSSDESVLRARAQRGVDLADYQIEVLETAKTDRFLSDPVSLDFSVPQGNYVFKVADTTLSFMFDGDTLKDLVARINELDPSQLRATLYQVDNQTEEYRFLIESLISGTRNTLTFEEVALEYAKKIGLLSDSRQTQRIIQPSDIMLVSETQPPTMRREAEGVLFESGSISEISINLPQDIVAQPREYSLEFSYELIASQNATQTSTDIESTISLPDSSLADSSLANTTDLSKSEDKHLHNSTAGVYEDIVIDGIESPLFEAFDLIDPSAEYPLVLNADKIPQYMLVGTKDAELNGTIQIPLESVTTENRIRVSIVSPLVQKDLRLFNFSLGKSTKSTLVPKNPLSQASDAQVAFEGVALQRPSNTIDDIIPGVTLDLLRASQIPVQVTIASNAEYIKDSIITFVGAYNILLQIINIYTENNESLLDNVSFESIEEREEYVSRLGALSGTISLIRLESQLQSLITRRWNLSAEQSLNSIQEIGISFRANTFTPDNNQQYLGLDEAVLDTTINGSLDAVKTLLGYDIDGDLVIDNGLAYGVSNLLQPYIQANGIVYQAKQTLSGDIGRSQTRIDRYEDGISRYEDTLRRDFGRMESAIEQLQDQSDVLDRFNSSGQ